jgi:lysophospholipase L1-like esterase
MRNLTPLSILVIMVNLTMASMAISQTIGKGKPVTTQTILFMGDSIAAGVGASNEAHRFSSLTVQRLQTKDCKLIEKNLAISGSTLVQSGFPVVLSQAIAEKPNIFVIQHGVNDNAVGNSLSEFLWAYRETVRTIKQKLPGTQIVCMTICPSWSHYNSDDQWCSQANAGIQEIAAREHTLLADIAFALQNRKEYFPDGIHPNDTGHQIMADTLVQTIQHGKIAGEKEFEFTSRTPGLYRLCGYIFEVKASDSVKQGSLELTGIGTGRMSYRSDYDVAITTPFNSFLGPFNVFMADNKTRKEIKTETDGRGRGLFLLPACVQKINVVIEQYNQEGNM